MIPDLRIGGKPVAWSELDHVTPVDPTTYLVTLSTGRAPSHTEARDQMVEALVQSGNDPKYARSVADSAASKHDRGAARRRG